MAWKMTHPDSDVTVEVEADQVANYASQGWSTLSGRTPSLPEPERAPDVVRDGSTDPA